MEIPGAVSSVATNKQPLKADFLSLLMAHETTNTKPLSAATDALNDESAAASSILDNSGIDSKHVVYSMAFFVFTVFFISIFYFA